MIAATSVTLVTGNPPRLACAMEWLGEARRRCSREIDGYTALQVEVLSDMAEIRMKQGESAPADAIAREWIAMAARTHMDAHVARAAKFIGSIARA